MFAQSAALLAWVVRQLAQDHPECGAGQAYCNVLEGPLVEQAPYGFLAAVVVAMLGYAVARASRIAWWMALLAEGAFGMGVVATDLWGEDVVPPGYLVLSALLVVGLLIGHDAFTAARRFVDGTRE